MIQLKLSGISLLNYCNAKILYWTLSDFARVYSSIKGFSSTRLPSVRYSCCEPISLTTCQTNYVHIAIEEITRLTSPPKKNLNFSARRLGVYYHCYRYWTYYALWQNVSNDGNVYFIRTSFQMLSLAVVAKIQVLDICLALWTYGLVVFLLYVWD